MYIGRTFADYNILRSKIYKSHECLGVLVEALTKYDDEHKLERSKTKKICEGLNI